MAAATVALAAKAAVAGVPAGPNIVAPGAPTFGDLRRRLELCQSGSGKEMASYVEIHPDDADRVVGVLSHFDTCYFAPHLEVGAATGLERILAGVGLYDPIVPPETVYAILNEFPQAAEIIELPCSHTERPEEAEWVRWEGTWIRAASRGHG